MNFRKGKIHQRNQTVLVNSILSDDAIDNSILSLEPWYTRYFRERYFVAIYLTTIGVTYTYCDFDKIYSRVGYQRLSSIGIFSLSCSHMSYIGMIWHPPIAFGRTTDIFCQSPSLSLLDLVLQRINVHPWTKQVAAWYQTDLWSLGVPMPTIVRSLVL